MSSKIVGIIFIAFGMGLLGDSIGQLYYNPKNLDYISIKSVLGVVLGIASCMYGYKRMKNG